MDSTLRANLPIVQKDVTIDGGNHTLSGDNQHRSVFVQSGNVAINDLTIANAKALVGKGGDGAVDVGLDWAVAAAVAVQLGPTVLAAAVADWAGPVAAAMAAALAQWLRTVASPAAIATATTAMLVAHCGAGSIAGRGDLAWRRRKEGEAGSLA